MTRALKIYYLAIAGLAVGIASFGVIQDRKIDELRRQTRQLRPQAAEVGHLKAEIEGMKQVTLDTNELAALRAEKLELMELRGKVSLLRKTAGLDESELKKEIERVRSQAEEKARQAKLIRNRQEAKERSKEVKGRLGNYLGVVREVTAGRFPASAGQLKTMIHQTIQRDSERSTYIEDWLKQLEEGGYPAEAISLFEFIPHPTLPAKDGPETLLLRERQPRSVPDGGWVRAYGTTHGRVLELTSTNGDFTSSEREWAEK